MWFLDHLLGAPIIGAILKPIVNGILTWQKQKLDAIGDHESQVAALTQRQMELDQREAEVDAAMVIAEQGHWMTRNVRPLMALPVVVLLWKLLVYDIALGQWTHGTTDKLGDQVWWIVTVIVIAYMGGRSAEKISDKLAGIFRKE